MSDADRPPGQAERPGRHNRVRLSGVPENAPVFDGTDIPMQYLFDYIDSRHNIYTFLRDNPQVTGSQVVEAIRERVRADIPAESVRGRVSGTPVFRGSRLPIQILFEYLAHGDSIEDYFESYPSADRAQVTRLLVLASNMMEAIAYENALSVPQA